jgi:hypothetical protein
MRREIWKGDRAEDGVLFVEECPADGGVWLIRSFIDGSQSLRIPLAAVPAVEAEASRIMTGRG